MTKTNLNSEDRILKSSCEIFVLYGYHATTLQKIATKASVSKASIHYYYRSKENLYNIIVEMLIKQILNIKNETELNHQEFERQKWFLITERYNNNELFMNTLRKIYPNNWNAILNVIGDWLENKHDSKIEFSK